MSSKAHEHSEQDGNRRDIEVVDEPRSFRRWVGGSVGYVHSTEDKRFVGGCLGWISAS